MRERLIMVPILDDHPLPPDARRHHAPRQSQMRRLAVGLALVIAALRPAAAAIGAR